MTAAANASTQDCDAHSKRVLTALADAVSRLKEIDRAKYEPIAIVGIGCRLPGEANDLASFERLLFSKGDAVGRVPASRWDADEFYDPDFAKPGRLYVREGAFLDGAESFDADFFGISPREARSLDPQHRMLLEVSWEALEDAGIRPSTLGGSSTGVFVGITCNDYARRLTGDGYAGIDAHFAVGNSLNAAAGRVSYSLGLQGPSLAIDTACSSSLVAVHFACQSLRGGECSLTLAGGVNLILSPEGSIAACRARMLSPDGRCKTFDAAADGYGRGEGCGVIVLKRLSDAIADGDAIHALIRGSAVNQDGASSGLTVPNGPAQQRLIAQALSAARVEPQQVAFLETHGTGTPLGDPIEYRAAVTSYGTARSRPLILGAVKANIGHLEAAAGIAGLIKAVIVLRRRMVPPQIHFRAPNPHIPWEELPAKVPTSPEPLNEEDRFVAASSFGASGTNAHVILEVAPDLSGETPARSEPHRCVFVLSAKTRGALRELASRFAAFVRKSADVTLSDVCYAAATTRDVFDHRLAIVATSNADLAEKLDRFEQAAGPAAGVFLSTEETDCERPQEPLADQARNFVLTGLVSLPVPEGKCRRVRLPCYPWQWQRFWPQRVTRDAETAEPIDDWFYELEWRRKPLGNSRPIKCEFCSPSVVKERLAQRLDEIRRDPDVRDYEGFIGSLERATTGYIVAALQTLGWNWSEGSSFELSQFMRVAGVRESYERLLRRLLEILKEDGLVARRDCLWKVVSAQRVNEVCAAAKGLEFVNGVGRTEAELLHRCGSQLSSVLTGHIEPLSILFPADGSVSAAKLYSASLGAGILNRLASDAVRHLLATLPARCPVRVLEIGAGTGSATAEFLQLFDAEESRYTVTDISPVLVDRSRDRFRHLGFVDFALLDIERSPDSQGFESHGYDIVIAANVIHATRDIAESLRHARQLLRPGGILVLLELTSRLRFIDLIFGLTEGWWRFSDAPLRQDYPLISPSQWEQVLVANGFAECTILGTSDPADGILSQQAVIIAQANSGSEIRIEAENSSWVFVGDRGGIAERVAGLLPTGVTRIVLLPGKAQHTILERASSRSVTGIVDFRSCDATVKESSGAAEVACACERVAGPALELLQTLATLHDQTIPVWFVTRGVVSLSHPTAASLPQSLISGMLKSVALEHPAWKCGCIDLSHDAPSAELHALINELRCGVADREVALRDDRWVSRLARVALPLGPSFSVPGDATYLITGGSRGLGPIVAHWLTRCGATHLALLSRTEPGEEAQRTLDVVRDLGCRLEIFCVDVADEHRLCGVLSTIESAMPPLRGIIHGAGVLDDAMLTHQNWQRFYRVLRAKTEGAWNLHRLTAHMPLDFFVLFSSMASLFGSPGQSNHAAANAFLDALACYRRGHGLPALSINWGPWSEQGAAVQRSVMNRIRGRGVGGIATGAGLRALERCLGSRAVQLGVVDVNWPVFLEQFAVGQRNTLLEAFARSPGVTLETEDGDHPIHKESGCVLARQVLEADAKTRPDCLREYVESRVREIGGIPATRELPLHRSLIELGFDSLMSTELRNRFLSELGIDLPIQTLIVGRNISEVVRLIGERLTFIDSSDDPFSGTELELEEIRL